MNVVDLSNPVNWQNPLNAGLVAWWIAPQGALGWDCLLDVGPCRIKGAAAGATEYSTPDVFGRFTAPVFDGSNDNFVLSGDVSKLEITGNKTAVAWVKTTTTATYREVLTLSSAGSFLGFTIALSGATAGRPAFYHSDSPYYRDASSGATNDGNWHQIAVTIEPGVGYVIYLDGQNVGSGSVSACSYSAGATKWIGAFPTYRWSAFTLGDIRYYDRCLSQGEILSLYETSHPANPRQYGDQLNWVGANIEGYSEASVTVSEWYAMSSSGSGSVAAATAYGNISAKSSAGSAANINVSSSGRISAVSPASQAANASAHATASVTVSSASGMASTASASLVTQVSLLSASTAAQTANVSAYGSMTATAASSGFGYSFASAVGAVSGLSASGQPSVAVVSAAVYVSIQGIASNSAASTGALTAFATAAMVSASGETSEAQAGAYASIVAESAGGSAAQINAGATAGIAGESVSSSTSEAYAGLLALIHAESASSMLPIFKAQADAVIAGISAAGTAGISVFTTRTNIEYLLCPAANPQPEYVVSWCASPEYLITNIVLSAEYNLTWEAQPEFLITSNGSAAEYTITGADMTCSDCQGSIDQLFVNTRNTFPITLVNSATSAAVTGKTVAWEVLTLTGTSLGEGECVEAGGGVYNVVIEPSELSSPMDPGKTYLLRFTISGDNFEKRFYPKAVYN